MNITNSVRERFNNMVSRGAEDDACWQWGGSKDRAGYGKLHVDRKGHPRKAHRVSWTIHNGEIPDGLHVLHRCDNRECTNPRHLFLGTHIENMADAKAKSRPMGPRPGAVSVNVGESNPRAKLTRAKVEHIRSAVAAGETQRSVADRFGVSQQAVSKVVHGLRW